MNLLANQITIAVTVYNRRQFIKQAVASAVNQSVPVRVIVVEDCGPDPTLESFVKDEFGPRIEYVRNPKRRGLFGNWNACLDACDTPWLSILHDDDYLAPGFVEAMMDLARDVPNQALYFGQTIIVDVAGRPTADNPLRPVRGPWQKIGLTDILYLTPFPFPGQLFSTRLANGLGNFRETSFYCGDWEMWARLIAQAGAAQTPRVVAYNRSHDLWDRGSNAVFRSGRHLPSTFIQHKRILALLPPGSKIKFDRVGYHRWSPMSIRFLLRHGASLGPRLLAYHVRLLLLSRPPHWRYALFQTITRIGGGGFVKLASKMWRRMN